MIPRHLLIGMAILLAAALGLGVYAWQMRKTCLLYTSPSPRD